MVDTNDEVNEPITLVAEVGSPVVGTTTVVPLIIVVEPTTTLEVGIVTVVPPITVVEPVPITPVVGRVTVVPPITVVEPRILEVGRVTVVPPVTVVEPIMPLVGIVTVVPPMTVVEPVPITPVVESPVVMILPDVVGRPIPEVLDVGGTVAGQSVPVLAGGVVGIV